MSPLPMDDFKARVNEYKELKAEGHINQATYNEMYCELFEEQYGRKPIGDAPSPVKPVPQHESDGKKKKKPERPERPTTKPQVSWTDRTVTWHIGSSPTLQEAFDLCDGFGFDVPPSRDHCAVQTSGGGKVSEGNCRRYRACTAHEDEKEVCCPAVMLIKQQVDCSGKAPVTTFVTLAHNSLTKHASVAKDHTSTGLEVAQLKELPDKRIAQVTLTSPLLSLPP